ncbi:MAG: WhiB family transcriptional regulator [Geminicoccaceae bacterium]
MWLNELRPDWHVHAACRGQLGLFFTEGRGIEAAAARQRALALCAVCPVIEECHQYATEHRVRIGIWGGQLQVRWERRYRQPRPAEASS